jgi:ribosomal-protein-alanine N-acetyltransferase
MTSDGVVRAARFPQDVAGIIRLMEVCFAEKLDADSRAAFREYRQLAAGGRPVWELARLFGVVHAEEWFGGVVLESEGRLVGNASITPGAFQPESWLIGNVAVLPECRRRGIGRALVRAALDAVRERGGRSIYLQVDLENESAARIYREFGFREISRRAVWYRPQGPLPAAAAPASPEGFAAARRKPAEWEDEYRWLQETIPEGLLWNTPIDADALRPSFWRSAGAWLAGDMESDWLVRSGGRIAGAARIHLRAWSQDAWLFVRPDAPGAAPALARAMLDSGGSSAAMNLETRADTADADLKTLGFQLKRTSLWMSRTAGAAELQERRNADPG